MGVYDLHKRDGGRAASNTYNKYADKITNSIPFLLLYVILFVF